MLGFVFPFESCVSVAVSGMTDPLVLLGLSVPVERILEMLGV